MVFEAELRLVPKERVSVRSLGIKAIIWVMVEGGDNSQVKSMTEELGENHSFLEFGALNLVLLRLGFDFLFLGLCPIFGIKGDGGRGCRRGA